MLPPKYEHAWDMFAKVLKDYEELCRNPKLGHLARMFESDVRTLQRELDFESRYPSPRRELKRNVADKLAQLYDGEYISQSGLRERGKGQIRAAINANR